MSYRTILINIETKSPITRAKFEQAIRDIGEMRIQGSGDTRPADLLIFELGDDIETEFEKIQSLLNSHGVDEVFLTSENNRPTVLLQAIKTGAKEFFSQPLKEQEIRIALERFKERRAQSVTKGRAKQGRIIDVVGSKGGVGTTTVAVNLAASLAQKKDAPEVALVDSKIMSGDIPIFLAFKPSYDWGAITENVTRLDAAFLTNLLTKHDCGVHVLPAPARLNGNHGAIPEVMAHTLGFMRSMFDFVVVDGGQTVDKTSLRIVEMSDSVLLMTVLNHSCLSNTKRLFNAFTGMGYSPRKRTRIVINRYLKNSPVSLTVAEDGLKEKIFWTIPNDYKNTIAAINQGKTLSQVASRSPINKNLKDLADKLSQSKEKPAKKRWGFLRRS
jgi:pilus assembly protein CpaE